MIDRGREPWIAVLAYEELARIYLDCELRGAALARLALLQQALAEEGGS